MAKVVKSWGRRVILHSTLEAQSKCCSHICVSISYSAKEATLDFKNYSNVVPNCKILSKQKQNRIKKFSCEKTADQFHNF